MAFNLQSYPNFEVQRQFALLKWHEIRVSIYCIDIQSMMNLHLFPPKVNQHANYDEPTLKWAWFVC